MYAKGLAKNQVCAIFHMRDIRKNVLPKFIKLCMETPCLCPFEATSFPGFSPTRPTERERENLENAGHVSPRIWEITNKRFEGGAGNSEICLYRA